MIKIFRVKNLNGWINCDWALDPQINIITGKNGSGKTTILKCLWYMISGNMERIPAEMSFDEIYVKTDKYSLLFEKTPDENGVRIQFGQVGKRKKSDTTSILSVSRRFGLSREVRQFLSLTGSSVFFPTFRRIEGGFSMGPPNEKLPLAVRTRFQSFEGVQEALAELEENLSNRDHKFVSSISTDDIVALTNAKYTSVSERLNLMHVELADKIKEAVDEAYMNNGTSDKVSEKDKLASARDSLDRIKRMTEEFRQKQKDLLAPFTKLGDLVTSLYSHKGIQVSEKITFGAVADAVSSSFLSAGEKQMLSFLCYNSFYSDSPIFIDEPEISLHVDWQRILFPILLKQNTNNQFVIATHSPFIYSKYEDKELMLSTDRGNNDATL